MEAFVVPQEKVGGEEKTAVRAQGEARQATGTRCAASGPQLLGE